MKRRLLGPVLGLGAILLSGCGEGDGPPPARRGVGTAGSTAGVRAAAGSSPIVGGGAGDPAGMGGDVGDRGGTPAAGGAGGIAGASSAGGARTGGRAGAPTAGGAGGGGGAPPAGGAAGAGRGGASSGGRGGIAGMGGVTTLDPCSAGPWTCIKVEGTKPYGSQTFEVPARQNWVNTGLYLHTGDKATLTESGTWQLSDSGSTIDHGPCRVGDLVARIGLYYKDPNLTCVKGTTVFTAPADGILFVGALAGNDLGETYETRSDASGKKTVTLTATGSTVPTVPAEAAATYAFGTVTSGWVEVGGNHVILTLPVDIAKKDAKVLAAATKRLDDIYELEQELRGAVPHHGQRLRFFPDGTNPGYMLAGNPIRMQVELVSGGDDVRISRAGEAGTGIWGFAHEMGHDFSFAPNGFWTYQENTLESWCNLFSIYSLEKLGVPLSDSTTSCTAQSTGNYSTWDAWGGLCFLRQFQFRYGWDFYKNYFRQINNTTSTGGDAWPFVYQQFGVAAGGKDVTPLFDSWNVPH